jgi:hypothetical protein
MECHLSRWSRSAHRFICRPPSRYSSLINYLYLFHGFFTPFFITDDASVRKTLTGASRGYSLVMGDRIGQAHIPGERRPMLSDGGSSPMREQQIDADSAEPPSLMDSLP